MPSNHLILCHPLLLSPSIFGSIRVFPNESVLHMRWPKYWSFSFSISPSSEHPTLISFRMDWLDLLEVLKESRDSQESSPTPQFKCINSSALSFLYTGHLYFLLWNIQQLAINAGALCSHPYFLISSPFSYRVTWFTKPHASFCFDCYIK